MLQEVPFSFWGGGGEKVEMQLSNRRVATRQMLSCNSPIA